MENIAKQINDIAYEWKDFSKQQEIQEDRLKSLESEINNLKGEISSMHIELSPTEEKYHDNLSQFARNGNYSMEQKSFSSSDPEQGGYAVSPERYGEIISKIEELSPLRKLASKETISSNVLELLIQDGTFDGGWVAEKDAREVTGNPKLIQKKIYVHEVYAQPKATQRLLDDACVNIESWITKQIVGRFAAAENGAFINGDGDNKPKGFLNCEEIKKIKVEQEGEISQVDLLNMVNKLEEKYQHNASFLMNRRTLALLQKIKDENGRFIFQHSISERMPDTIFGIPVYCTSDMPAPEADKIAVALGDFRAGYKIVDRQGISLMKDPFTEKPFVKFYATKRVGGDVIDSSAINLLVM